LFALAPDGEKRDAALEALRHLADVDQVDQLVAILKSANDTETRRKVALALMVVCGEGRERCVAPVAAALDDADEATRVVLLRALARCGGAAALEAIAARRSDDSRSVRDEAVRMLANWPNAAAAYYLEELAKDSDDLRYQVLGIRGLVRLASPRKDRLADVDMLASTLRMATRTQEKVLALGALGNVASSAALAAVLPAIEDASVAREAALSAIRIAEGMIGGDEALVDRDKGQIRTAMQKVLDRVQNPETRQRAQGVLDSL